MLSKIEHAECIRETLQDLREDAALLQMSLMGLQCSVDELTLSCLLRLTDYLHQHVHDICYFCAPHKR